MRWIGVLLAGLWALAVAGCAVPSPGFGQAEAIRTEIMGSRFVMRRRGDLVEVIRVNPEWAPRLSQQLGRRAEIAIEEAYGCPVKEIRGDPSLMFAKLKCGASDDLAKIGYGRKAGRLF